MVDKGVNLMDGPNGEYMGNIMAREHTPRLDAYVQAAIVAVGRPPGHKASEAEVAAYEWAVYEAASTGLTVRAVLIQDGHAEGE